MTRVLIAVDGTEFAEEAARRALELLGDDIDVTLAEVVAPTIVPMTVAATSSAGLTAPISLMDPAATQAADAASRAIARADVADVARRLPAPDADIQVMLGEAGPALCRAAEEGHYDLIVVGTHHHGPLRRVLLGSVSDHLVHHAPCPVLVVPSGVEEDD